MKKILLVEDHPEIAFGLSCILELAGHSVRVESNIQNGLSSLTLNAFDLLISDFNLPDGNGDRVIQRANQLGIPSVLITGSREVQNVADAVNSGATLVVLKPFDLERLLSEVERLLATPNVAVKKLVRLQFED